ncbi:hypothetical protein SSP35_22_00230 [Streptomyces sp. NBRC 110611]|uniref:hypothetical protein n=1 Tax=Streptomyces sp. NBRC 110611 TaxID=1621259 RepID=UPI00082D4962|nr:hypothetical protein [Streptomyces sp. NBRC 110611]GAU70720.1 hypothetical protein SSP35_22_00230 [Streptomyces sp. NBRC 110611]
MTHPSSAEIAARIEDLYGAPLADLEAHAQDKPPGMLAALLGMHHSLAVAERSIAVQRDRLAQLVHPDRQIGTHQVSHVLDCARRLAEAVAVRDVQTKTVCAVLKSLGRVSSPQSSPAPVPAVPSPAVAAASAAPIR